MRKKLLTILLALSCSLSLMTACGKGADTEEPAAIEAEATTEDLNESEDAVVDNEAAEGIQAQDPSEFAEQFYKKYFIDQTQDINTIWENCISEKTKELGFYKEEDYISDIKQMLFENTLTDVLVTSYNEVQPDIYEVNVSLKLTENGKESTDSTILYIIKEGNQYSLLLSGVTDYTTYDNTSENDSDFSLNNLKMYTTVSGLYFEYDFVNNSGTMVYLGPWANPLIVNMTTKDGTEHTATFDNPIQIANHNSDHETLFYNGATGEPAKLEFETITYMNESGMPNGTTSYTVTLN